MLLESTGSRRRLQTLELPQSSWHAPTISTSTMVPHTLTRKAPYIPSEERGHQLREVGARASEYLVHDNALGQVARYE